MSSAKERHIVNMVKYLGNPEKDWPTRVELALEVCKYKDANSIYKTFTPEELSEIEKKGLALRKEQTSGQRAIVYQSLFNEARKGNVQAAKEFLDRTEGKVKDNIDLNAMIDQTTRVEVEIIRPGMVNPDE